MTHEEKIELGRTRERQARGLLEALLTGAAPGSLLGRPSNKRRKLGGRSREVLQTLARCGPLTLAELRRQCRHDTTQHTLDILHTLVRRGLVEEGEPMTKTWQGADLRSKTTRPVRTWRLRR